MMIHNLFQGKLGGRRGSLPGKGSAGRDGSGDGPLSAFEQSAGNAGTHDQTADSCSCNRNNQMLKLLK